MGDLKPTHAHTKLGALPKHEQSGDLYASKIIIFILYVILLKHLLARKHSAFKSYLSRKKYAVRIC